MKASSESGLWALTISWGATGFIREPSVYTTRGWRLRMEGRIPVEKQKKKGKGRPPDWVVNWEATVGDHPVSAYDALPCIIGRSVNPTVRCFLTTCSLPADEAALIVVRLYMSPPANPGWGGLRKSASVAESTPA